MIVAKYKFNPNTYADLLPEFNSEFTEYTTSDVNNGDGTITRTIESDSLPTFMRFGETSSGESDTTDKSKSLLDILDMNTSNLTNANNMFRYCVNLTSIICNWNISKVTSMVSMFNNCSSLTSLDVSNWNTSQVTNMNKMFNNCSSLTQLDVSNWNTSNVTNMSNMFQNCSSLTSLNISNWDTGKVTNMANMFNGCKALTSLDLNNWDTSNVTNMKSIFYDCKSLRKIKMINSTIPQLIEILPTRASSSVGYLFSPTPIPNEKNWNTILTYTGYNITIKTSQPLGKNDKLYWSSSNNRFEIDRNGVIEVPTVEGDIVDLPRLYQKIDTTISISTDNIKPSKIDISYKDIN